MAKHADNVVRTRDNIATEETVSTGPRAVEQSQPESINAGPEAAEELPQEIKAGREAVEQQRPEPIKAGPKAVEQLQQEVISAGSGTGEPQPKVLGFEFKIEELPPDASAEIKIYDPDQPGSLLKAVPVKSGVPVPVQVTNPKKHRVEFWVDGRLHGAQELMPE